MGVFTFVTGAEPPEEKGGFPEFVPRRGLWPLGQLIEDIMGQKKMPLSQLTERMSIEGAKVTIGAISRCVFHLDCSEEFLSKLAIGLGIDQSEVDRAIDETNQAIEAEKARLQQWQDAKKRALFVPRLDVHHERQRPSPIFPTEYSGWKFVPLPEGISQQPWDEQVHTVGGIIRQHYGATKKTPFGDIVSYTYRPTYDGQVQFDTTGQLKAPLHDQDPTAADRP